MSSRLTHAWRRPAAIAVLALLVTGCGESKGTYARFDDDVTAKGWEVWRDPVGHRLYLRSIFSYADSHSYSCADNEARLAVRIVGPTLQRSLGSSGLREVPPSPPRRYVSIDALWRDQEEHALVTRVEVEAALRNGVARAKPDWVKNFERNCPHGDRN